MECIDFDFIFPNIYIKAQGLRYVLEEGGATPGSSWHDDCQRIDVLLCAEGTRGLIAGCTGPRDELYSSMALASIEVGMEHIDILQKEAVPISREIAERARSLLSGSSAQGA